MTVHYEGGGITLYAGDCLDVLATLPDASVDAVVTDPPYGLEFMGKEWDAPWQETDVNTDAGFNGGGIDATKSLPSFTGSTNPKCLDCKGTRRGRRDGTAKVAVCLCDSGGRFPNVRAVEMRAFGDWCELWAAECLRVLKPGGHLLAFGGTRTWHRLACAVEDAGFEVRDSIAWLYGSGFPKSLRVSRDERFCHCDATVHTNSRTSHEPPPAGHTSTQDAAGVAERGERSAHHATRTALDSPADCRGEHGSDGGPLRQGPGPDRSSLPSLEDARGRSRSAALGDGPGAGSSRNPSQARRSGHPSSQGYPSLSDAPSSPDGGMGSSSTERLRTDSGNGSLASGMSHTGGSLSAWPNCLTCGKPQANGLGTALKPAHEPIVVARKPLAGTVAANVLTHGTGALNIDGCRIEATDSQLAEKYASVQNAGPRANSVYGTDGRDRAGAAPHVAGRWPANVVLDDTQAAALDQQSGEQRARGNLAPTVGGGGMYGHEETTVDHGAGDTGGASRFFYTAKAATDERVRIDGTAHPTVKPLSLMRWLVRLVTPPGGTILEPFAGSGTTVEAAILEGFHCIAIEREADYLPLIIQRINRRRDPVAAVKATGDDGGLFDLLDEEPA